MKSIEKNNLILGMVQDLLKKSTDDYNQARYTLLAVAKSDNLQNFVKALFAYTDTQRPLPIEMKGGVM